MEKSTFHIAMFPWFAMGHITTYMDLSNMLASKGYRITFFIPTKVHQNHNHINLHSHRIQFIPLVVPHVDGLPLSAETLSDVSPDKLVYIEQAFDLTQDQVSTVLHNLKPDFVFYDCAYWIPTLAHSLGIKCIYFSTMNPVSQYRLVPSMLLGKTDNNLDLKEPPPEIYPGSSSAKPRTYEMKEIISALKDVEGRVSIIKRIFTAMYESDALCFRACKEMEAPFTDYLLNQYKKPVLLLGPLLTLLEAPSPVVLEEKWAKWLGGYEKGSVVYCAFGSECVLKIDQFQELVLGLEETGLPFLVRLKPPFGAETLEEALPEGFEERVRGRGVVYGGWVQQKLILSHPSVGCFVGHCGSGSLWESLATSCQLVAVPHIGDQIPNAEFLTRNLKVAVEVERRDEDGWFTKENVCKAVKSVMDEGSEIGKEVRNNHISLNKLLLSEGFQSSYINNFIIELGNLLK